MIFGAPSAMRSHFPLVTVLLAAAAATVQSIPGAAEGLQFDRAAILGGEWWRGWTAHLAHFSANHATWDIAALLALGAVCETRSRVRLVVALALAATAIAPALWFLQPQFETYRGLSGLDSALFGLLAGSLWFSGAAIGRLAGALALVAVLGKCTLELATHAPVFADGIGYAPVPLAHVIGALCGALAALPRLTFRCAASSATPQPCP